MLINKKIKEKVRPNKPNKKKNNCKSKSRQKIKSKQRSKRLKTFNSSDFQLFEAQDNNLNDLAGQVLFKNDILNIKIKKNHNQIPSSNNFNSSSNNIKPQINFNSTINNYTSVYTVISNREKQKKRMEKAKSQKNINSSKSCANNSGNPVKKKNISTTVNVNMSSANANGVNLQQEQRNKSRSKIQKNKNKQRTQNNYEQNYEKLQPYEYIPPSKNSFSSQIVFSTQDTRRQLKIINQQKMLKLNKTHIDKLGINLKNLQINNQEDSQTLFDTNKIVRFSIKQQYKRKNQAAIKIQKVFRGFLTRKILMKYVNNQQERLGVLLGEYKSSSGQKSQTHRSNQFFGEISQRQRQGQTEREQLTSKTFKDANESLNISQNMSPTNFKIVSSYRQDFGGQYLKKMSESEQQSGQSSNLQGQQDQQQSSSSSEQMGRVYRHQQPIYSHEQISKYLQSSDQEKDFDQYAYQQNIIFQTNEEYLQSRKSSLQNNPEPKNKLSRGLLNQTQLNYAIKESQEQFQQAPIQKSQNFHINADYQEQPKIGSIKSKKINQIVLKQQGDIKQRNDFQEQNDQFKIYQQQKLQQRKHDKVEKSGQQYLGKTSKITGSNSASHKASIQQIQSQLLSTNLISGKKIKQNGQNNQSNQSNQDKQNSINSPAKQRHMSKSVNIDVDNSKTQKKQSCSYRQHKKQQTYDRDESDQQMQQNRQTINPKDIFSQTISYNSEFKQKYLLPNNYKDYKHLKDQRQLHNQKLKLKESGKKCNISLEPFQISMESKFVSQQEPKEVPDKDNIMTKKASKRSKLYYFQDQFQDTNQQATKLQQCKRQVHEVDKQQNQSQYAQQQMHNSQSFHKLKTFQQLQRIKKSQEKKWDQIISLIKNQKSQCSNNNNDKIKGKPIFTKNNQQIQQFMNQILQLSQKNKTLLNLFDNKSPKNLEILASFDQSGQILNQIDKNSRKNGFKQHFQRELQQQDFNIRQLQELKDSISSLNSSRRSSITGHDITVAKPSVSSRTKLQKQLTKKIKNQQSEINSSNNKQKNLLTFFKETKIKEIIQDKSNTKGTNTFILDENKEQQKQIKHQIQPNYKVSIKNNQKSHNTFKKASQKTSNISQGNNLKTFISSHIQNDHIEQMLKLREQLLQKRQCDELTSLNLKLMKREISQIQFLNELNSLMKLFKDQKQCIDKTREDITKGYNAAYQLMRQALQDAKRMGYKLPFSKSSQSYKNKSLSNVFDHHNNGFISLNHNFDGVVIDQVSFSNKRAQQSKCKKAGPLHKFCLQQPYSIDQYALEEAGKKQRGQIRQGQKQQQKKFNAQYQELADRAKPKSQKILDSTAIESKNSEINKYSQLLEVNQNFSQNLSNFSSHNNQNWSSQSENNRSRLMFQIQNMSDNQSSSDLEFTEDELIRFRRVQQSYNSQIADLNRNMMIGGDFAKLQNQHRQRQQSIQGQIQSSQQNQEPKNKRLYRQVYQIQQDQDSDNIQSLRYQQRNFQGKSSTQVQLITEKQLQYLIWQISCQILMKPIFSQKILHKKRQQIFAPKKLTDQNRADFIQQVWKILPSSTDIQKRLNQNIAPMPKELLKCMRIDFSQYQDEDQAQNIQDDDYQEVGKYEMILDQQICNTAIQNYKKKMKEIKQKIQIQQKLANIVPQIQDFQQQYKNLGEKPLNYLAQRQRFIKSKKQYSQDISWQFTNMQLHCLFDSWNQILIELNTNKAGFSGIGLNQLTLSMIDQNNKIDLKNIAEVTEESKFRLLKILGLEESIISEINKKYKNHLNSFSPISLPLSVSQQEEEEENSRNFSSQMNKANVTDIKKTYKFDIKKYSWVYKQQEDQDQYVDYCLDGKWIEYSHQALSFFLQIVYLVQQDLFRQLSRQLNKFQLKSALLGSLSSKHQTTYINNVKIEQAVE